MGCNCGGGANRQQFEVIASNGKTVFTSSSKATAETVATRYPGSKVEQKGKAAATPAAPAKPPAD